MGRSESKQVANQGMAQSAQDQAQAQKSFAATNKSLGDYTTSLDNFMKFGRSVYGAGGEFQRDQNTIANTTAAAGSAKIGGDLALNAMRTGENTSNYAPTLAESKRQASRDLTSELATADSDRLSKLTAINQYGVDASKFPATVQESLYGRGVSGSASQLDPAANAAKTPGFWDLMGPALAQGAGAAAGGFCPCKGSIITLSEYSTVFVEDIHQGDSLAAMGFAGQSNPVEAEPVPVRQPALEIVTRNGLRHCASRTHAVALAEGGYARMAELLGKVILTAHGGDEVTKVIDIGEQIIYPMQVGGSHCYLADGIWCFS